VACNIGNPHELGQAPITFFRQVLALAHYPSMLTHKDSGKIFAPDAIERAASYLKSISGGTGAYTTSQGIRAIRQEVASFLEARDGVPANAEDVFLTDGASAGVKMVLNLIIRNKTDGVLTPIPQYPLYSASLTLFGGECVKYFLDEEASWGLTRAELERAYAAGVESGVKARALVVINPGNPTGQCLPRSTMREIVEFCAEKNLLLMADEVYQTNVYAATPFTSFKAVVSELKSPVSLVSFHSVSKGFLGECGQRGGFFELVNVHADMKEQLVKLASVSLCSNTSGQIMTGLMVNPPKEGQASHALYAQERDAILASLKRRAKLVATELNTCTGVRCNEVEGALYAFPRITLPARLVSESSKLGKAPDVVYALELLEATGICVVPGSGFGQKEGTWHFRTTILPSEKAMDGVMKRFKKFHEEFMKKYE
jgi:aspartate/methionine/tyrosine aminotransferase